MKLSPAFLFPGQPLSRKSSGDVAGSWATGPTSLSPHRPPPPPCLHPEAALRPPSAGWASFSSLTSLAVLQPCLTTEPLFLIPLTPEGAPHTNTGLRLSLLAGPEGGGVWWLPWRGCGMASGCCSHRCGAVHQHGRPAEALGYHPGSKRAASPFLTVAKGRFVILELLLIQPWRDKTRLRINGP